MNLNISYVLLTIYLFRDVDDINMVPVGVNPNQGAQSSVPQIAMSSDFIMPPPTIPQAPSTAVAIKQDAFQAAASPAQSQVIQTPSQVDAFPLPTAAQAMRDVNTGTQVPATAVVHGSTQVQQQILPPCTTPGHFLSHSAR